MRYERILAAVAETPWAITQEKFLTMLGLLELRANGDRLTAEEIAERIGAVERPVGGRNGTVAVIPIFGVMAQRMGLMEAASGGTSTERIASDFRAALADPAIGSIVLNIDSPGGSVYGVAELADLILKSRGQKPITALANSLAASAAYWTASAADEIVVTPGGEVGSIGVVGIHEDMSAAYEKIGVKTTLLSAGRFKTEGNPYEPLSEEAASAMQARIDDYYAMFVRAVAKGRGVTPEDVRSGFGEGRVVGAQQAVKLGMADRVDTLEGVIQTISRRRAPLMSAAHRLERFRLAIA